MKKQIPFLIISLILIFISSFLFIVSVARLKEGYGGQPFVFLFILSILLNFLYYFWLFFAKRIDHKLKIFYIPAAIVIFIIFCRFIASPPWIKEVKFDMGPDPFFEDTNITSGMTFTIWQKEFWSKSAREEFRLKIFKEIQVDGRSSLIAHIGDDLQGWGEEKVKYAFGDPAEVIQADGGLEKWIYHPWLDHPEWEMPVYIENGVLTRIGD